MAKTSQGWTRWRQRPCSLRPGDPLAKFRAEITLPVDAKGLLESNSYGRSKVRIKTGKSSTTINVESEDISAFKAALNSTLRDIVVVGSVSKAAERK
ncbi:MAG: hypothetical protein KGH94_05185 [Candidatus Micrarchaeota archaeon]|nr:hypothetical protein [Candidatus Micrarchaeota archaeon]